jgi:hypothetical protein
VASSASSALAQSDPEATAEAHVQRGLELRRAGDDAAALAEFDKAERLLPVPRVRAQIALALQALGRWREAEDVQLLVLSQGADPWVREHDQVLRESLAAVQRHLSWLTVDCNVAGAEVVVNGASVGRAPLGRLVRVVAGSVVLEVHAEGYEPVRRTIEVPAGARERESVVLVPSPAAPRPTPAGPAAPVVVADAASARRAAGWVVVASGGVILAGGAVAFALSAAYGAKYNDDSRCYIYPLSRDERCGVERGISDTTFLTGIVALAAGGLAAGAGVVLLVTSPSQTRVGRGAPSVACRVTLGGIGCGGQF